MAANPAGYVPIFDGGNPRIIGGMCYGGSGSDVNVSGGDLVFAESSSDAVSSGANSFVTSDVGFTCPASGLQFNGIAVQTTTSGTEIAVATRGAFLLRVDGTCTAGHPVLVVGLHAVQNAATTLGAEKIGRALTTATSGNYALIDISA